MSLILHKSKGFLPILMALGIVMALGVSSLVLNVFGRLNARKELEKLNRMEAFYTGEILSWHHYARDSRGLTPLDLDDKKNALLSIDTDYSEGLPNELIAETYQPSSYKSGDPLNLKATQDFDATSTLIRRYHDKGALYRESIHGSVKGFCGKVSFQGTKSIYQTCLSPVAVILPPAGGPSNVRLRVVMPVDVRALPSHDLLNSVRVQKDGKIWVQGTITESSAATMYNRLAVARFRTDGKEDISFGDLGRLQFWAGYSTGETTTPTTAGAGMLLPDETTILMGITRDPSQSSNTVEVAQIRAVRFDLNGHWDRGFKSTSIELTHNSIMMTGFGMTDPKTTTVTEFFPILYNDKVKKFGLFVASYLSGGGIDFSNRTSGYTFTELDPRTANFGISPIRQSDGKFVVATELHLPANQNYYPTDITRFSKSGELDTDFGTSGSVKFNHGYENQYLEAMATHNTEGGEKILVLGTIEKPRNMLLTRYELSGQMDKSFGEGGKVVIDWDDKDQAKSLAVDANGRITLVGVCDGGIALARVSSEGKLDLTFGDGGKVCHDKPKHSSIGSIRHQIAIHPDGKFLVGFTGSGAADQTNITQGDFCIVRYLSDGRVDTSFGVEGITQIEFGESVDIASGISFQPDGLPVILGTSYDSPGGIGRRKATLVRFAEDGNLDTNFGLKGREIKVIKENRGLASGGPGGGMGGMGGGSGGMAGAGGMGGGGSSDFNEIKGQASGLVFQSDKKTIVSLVITDKESSQDGLFVARYLSDGKGDPDFGSGAYSGYISLGWGVGSMITPPLLLPDGKILVGGIGTSCTDLCISRLKSDGKFDDTFGTGGTVQINLGKSVQGVQLYTKSGSIFVAAEGAVDLSSQFFVIKLKSDGIIETSFGREGIGSSSEFPNGDHDYTALKAIDGDTLGRIVLGGNIMGKAALFRFTPEGTIDPTFGDKGIAIHDCNPDEFDEFTALSMLSDGKIFIAGNCLRVKNKGHAIGRDGCSNSLLGKSQFTVALLQENGTLDTAFAEGGYQTLLPYEDSCGGRATSIAIRSDGLIAVGGSVSSGWDADYAIALFDTK